MIAVHLKQGQVEVRKIPKPRRPDGFALIRLLAGGICNTDLELKRGYYSFEGIPGHEFVGEVAEADDLELVGKRVVGEINVTCNQCDWCARNLGRHCPERKVLGIVNHPGAFREFLTLPEQNLHVIPDQIPNEHAVFVEPIAAACEILDQVEFPKRAAVAVLGDGKLGLLISQVLQASGVSVVQFGRHASKLAIAEKMGVATELNVKKMPVAAYDWVVDATGSPEGLRTATAMARPRGTVILKSTMHGEVPVDTAPIIVNELTLVGSRCGRFDPAIRMLRSGKINVADMISESFALGDAPRAFARAEEPGVMKVLLQG